MLQLLPEVSGKLVSNLVIATSSDHTSFWLPRKTLGKILLKPQPGTSRDQVNINPVTAIDISPLPTFYEKCRKTNPCAGSAQVITSSPYMTLVKDAKNKKPVNKEGFQIRSQEKNVRNVPGTDRKLLYRQKKQVIHGRQDES
jgi:hypothetical protein